jgi:heme exporter protein B
MMRLLRYELAHYGRHSGATGLCLACYLMLVFIMGYATQHHHITADIKTTLDPVLAFQWMAMSIAAFLGFERIWLDDARDHILTQQKLSPHGLSFFIVLKTIGFWIGVFLPLLLVYAVQYALTMPLDGIGILLAMLPFALASVALCLLLVLASALALGSRNGMLIVFLVMVPLMLPVLTFGLGAHIALNTQQSPAPSLSLLAAYTLFNLVLVPAAVHYMLRQHR